MDLKYLLVFLLLAIVLGSAVNCNDRVEALEFDPVETLEDEDVTSLDIDPRCLTSEVCKLECKFIKPGCNRNVYIADYVQTIPADNAAQFAQSYLSRCVFQRGQFNSGLSRLKTMLSSSLRRVALKNNANRGNLDRLTASCSNPNVAYSVILNEMLHLSEPVLKALSRTFQLLMSIQRLCAKDPDFKKDVKRSIEMIFGGERSYFLKIFKNQVIADKFSDMARDIKIAVEQEAYTYSKNVRDIQVSVISEYTQYILENQGLTPSPCSCYLLSKYPAFTTPFQQSFNARMALECAKVC